jgi:hypothetical protein
MRSTKKSGPGVRTQCGQTFLVLVLLIFVGAGALLYNLVSPGKIAIERDRQTHAALAQAKDALIGFAAGLQYSGTERPGNLPCPDVSGFGSQGNNCNSDGLRIGRLPWKTLGLAELRDGHGEPLWYAVSDNFKKATATGILNSATPGNLTVSGTMPANNVIAIVFAPGPVVLSQDRNPNTTSFCDTTKTSMKNHLCSTNYLEGGNENADTIFVSGPTTTTFNDKLLIITSDHLFPAVEMRVARTVREALNSYLGTRSYFPLANAYSGTPTGCTPSFSGRIPINPADCGQGNWVSALPNWFFNNNWHEVLFYGVAPSCTSFTASSCDGSGGFLTVDVVSNIGAILITPGRAFAGQNRPCATVADCLEDAENTNGDSTYTKPIVSSTVNDRLVIVSP